MQKPTLNYFHNRKIKYLSLVLLILLCFNYTHKASAQASSIKDNVSFTWEDTQINSTDSATLESIDINGRTYNSFVVPSAYEMTRLGPEGDSGNLILLNGVEVMDNSGDASWDAAALNAFQSLNLNHYFRSSDNGRDICGDYVALTTTDAQIQSIKYDPGIPSNEDGVLAVTERNANNCMHISIYGTPEGGGSDQLLGQTYIYPGSHSSGAQPNTPPTTSSDYWLTERVNDNDGTIGVALFELSQLAPVGSIIREIRFTAATVDVGDGKFFLMQTYAVDDIFESEFNETFSGDVSANDNVPENTSYSYFTSVDPLNGSVIINSDGTFTYTPNPGYVGTEVFEIQVCLPPPNQSECDISTVTLTIKPNNLPIAIDDNYTVNEDIPDNIFNVLDNDDFGPDGPQDNNALAIITVPSNGSATVNDNGTPSNPLDDYILYTPNPYYNGSDSLVYEITDGNGSTASATVYITVTPDTSKQIDIITKNISVNEDIGVATITVQIQGNYQVGPTINYTTADNTAISGSDYDTTNGSYTFAGNNNETFSFNVPITDDLLIEASEIIDIEVITNSYSSPLTLNTTIEIIDNDGTGSEGLSIVQTDVVVTEGLGVTAIFDVTLTGNFAAGFDADFSTAFGTATATDITPITNGTLSFLGNDGEIKQISVDILDDSIIEPQEAYTVTLNSVTNPLVPINNGAANGIINDDDSVSGTGIQFDNTNVIVTEGTDTFARFTVTLTGTISENVTVDYATNNNTALNGTDFTAQTGTITFTPSANSFDIDVPIINDLVIESQEEFTVVLSNIVSNLTIGFVNGQPTNTANGTINDDDGIAGNGISFVSTNVEVTEGVGVTATFEAILTGNFQDAFDVAFETAFGTATNTDFEAQNGTVSFTGNDGEIQTIVVNILDDDIIEPTEGYVVNLTGTTNPLVTINTPQATGTILDDDGGINDGISFVSTNVEVTEGVGVTATFEAILTGNFQDAFDVAFETAFGTATNTDFEAQNGTVSFTGNDGEIQTIVVNILDDDIIEPTEGYVVNLTGTTNPLVTINTPQATGTILDDDSDASLGIQFDTTSIDVNEDAGTVSLNVVLNTTVQDEFTIAYHTIDGTATDSFDYSGVATGTQTLTFGGTNPNTQVIVIPIIDDIIIENTEDFQALLSNISTTLVNILGNDMATVNIIDNDGNEGWPENITVEACDTIPAPANITSNSNCAINVVLNEEIEGQDDECATEYILTRTWSITDCVGNVREHIQVITIEDTIAPTFVEALPQDMTVVCNEVPDAAVLTAVDNCESNIEVTFTEVVTNDANCEIGYTVTRTWNASDCAGNVVTHTQIITVPPTGPIMANYEEEITILCGDVVPEAPELTFTGGCGNYDVIFNEEIQIANDSGDFMIIRTWNVTDSCDNTSSFEQIIFVLQPQLEEVTIDICIEDEAINLINYIPEGFDTNGEFTILEGNVVLNGSMFDPLDHRPEAYKIAYTSTGGECKYFVDFTINVNTDCVPCGLDQIEISKTITPNGDGINDRFEIRGVEFCQFSFDIMLFNRWGDKIAEIKDYHNDWGGESPNGSFGSSGVLPAGTYYYIVNATDTETGTKLSPFNGYIYLSSE